MAAVRALPHCATLPAVQVCRHAPPSGIDDLSDDSATPLLDRVTLPADLRKLPESDLRQLADELRQETISAVSVTGGHLGAGLGVVELTVALHYVFDTPRDRLIWDVGHQAYPHKILTGRRDRIRTLRQPGGLSGFTRRAESAYDPFGTAHSSTSISAALGMAVARDLDDGDNNVIAVIGDGAMSAGMAYEAMNNAGHLRSRLIVVLNDNDMSIAPPVGAMSAHLARLVSGRAYRKVRRLGKRIADALPRFVREKLRLTEEFARGFWTGGTMFEELGFYYVGPIDGHNLDHLLPVLRNVKAMNNGPILVHVVTKKGKGYAPAEESDDKYHGVSTFDVVTGKQAKGRSNAPSYTRVFAESLIREAQEDPRIVAITAAMPAAPDSTSSPRRSLSAPSTLASPSSTPSPSPPALPPKASSRSRRSIPPSSSAPTTRSSTTWRSRACRSASPSIARGWSAPTGRPTPVRTTPPSSPACRGSW